MMDTSKTEFYKQALARRDKLQQRLTEITEARHRHEMPHLHETEMLDTELDLIVYNRVIMSLEDEAR
jgi:hypothetical protein